MQEQHFFNKCPSCKKEIDLVQVELTYSRADDWKCPNCKGSLNFNKMLLTMYNTSDQNDLNSSSLTQTEVFPTSLRQLHDKYGGENIINTDPEVDNIPDIIWFYNYKKHFSEETLKRIKSATLVQSYYGGKRNGMPFKRSYVFIFWDKLVPRPGIDDPFAAITFTLNLEDGTIRFIEGVNEFKTLQPVSAAKATKITQDLAPEIPPAAKDQDLEPKKFLNPLIVIIIFAALIGLIIFLKLSTQAPKEEQRIVIALVTSKTANIRSGPSQANPIVFKVKSGDTLLVISAIGEWLFVKKNDIQGYIYYELVKKQLLIK